MGTIGLEATESLASQVARERPDIAFVDAPVSGSRGPARNGGLLILASGPEHAEPILAPVFAALGQRTLWLGAAGAGTRMKLILNTWLAFEVEAVAEVSALATRLGVSYQALLEAVSGGTLASGVALTKLAKIEQGDDAGGVLGTGVDAEVDAKVGADVDSDIHIDTGVGVDTCASVGVDIDFEAIADVSESNYIKHRTNQKVKRTH